MVHSARFRIAHDLSAIRRTDEERVANPVLESCVSVAGESNHVVMNRARLNGIAASWSEEKLEIPKWDAPVFLGGNEKQVVDFLMVGNSINFNYTSVATGKKYEFNYNGVPWRGAFGMWAALKHAHESGIPVLDGDFLAGMSREKAVEIFRPDLSEMPMFDERVRILNEVGKTLVDKYDSHFHNVLEEADGRIFNRGRGLVELLVSDFPSFDDKSTYRGRTVVFNKRAQLIPIMLYGKLAGMGKKAFPQEDLELLTVASNYELPKVLRAVGVLEYRGDLGGRVDRGEPVAAGSEEEIEIRANTICACRLMQDEINVIRGSSPRVTALEVDYKLWSVGVNYKQARHHLTMTTAY